MIKPLSTLQKIFIWTIFCRYIWRKKYSRLKFPRKGFHCRSHYLHAAMVWIQLPSCFGNHFLMTQNLFTLFSRALHLIAKM